MTTTINSLFGSLEKWSATVFLLAGGLSLVGLLLSVVGSVMAVSMQAPSSLAVFTAVVLSFVALLGLYRRLADEAPRVAQVGILLIMFPLIFTFVLLVWHSPEVVGIDVPSLLLFLPSPALVYGVTFVLTAIGITIFGIGGLRTAAFAPVVCGLLFVLAAAWVVLIGAASVYGFPIPDWVANVQGGIMGVAMVALGYVLRSATVATSHTEPASESTT